MKANEISKWYVDWANSLDSAGQDSLTARAKLNDHNTIRLLHACMGLCTETGELNDAVKKYIFYGKPIDRTNVLEEAGDLLWYLALIAKYLNLGTFDEIMERNFHKLVTRYGTEWNQDGALNRDLEKERLTLEFNIKECPDSELQRMLRDRHVLETAKIQIREELKERKAL